MFANDSELGYMLLGQKLVLISPQILLTRLINIDFVSRFFHTEAVTGSRVVEVILYLESLFPILFAEANHEHGSDS